MAIKEGIGQNGAHHESGWADLPPSFGTFLLAEKYLAGKGIGLEKRDQMMEAMVEFNRSQVEALQSFDRDSIENVAERIDREHQIHLDALETFSQTNPDEYALYMEAFQLYQEYLAWHKLNIRSAA